VVVPNGETTLTFVDAGVLIAAARGTDAVSEAALALLGDPNRTFASSPFVRLEGLPKAVYYGNREEEVFYRAYFESVSRWADHIESIVEEAEREARTAGLAAVDAPHVAAARQAGARELVTNESRGKPLFRVTGISVLSIRP